MDVEKYVEWSTFDEPDGMDAMALYNERGEALKRTAVKSHELATDQTPGAA